MKFVTYCTACSVALITVSYSTCKISICFLIAAQLMLKKSAPTGKLGYYLTQSLARGITGRDLTLHTTVPHPGLV